MATLLLVVTGTAVMVTVLIRRRKNEKMRILKFLKKDILIFITGLALVSYPVISNYIESREQAGQIDTYNSSVNELSSANKQLVLNEAYQWNNSLYSKQKGLSEDSGLEYENVLNFGNGVIGTVEIPKIKVNMPVYHGQTVMY